jgi:uncharacterized membrane protein
MEIAGTAAPMTTSSEVGGVLERNIEALIRHREQERSASSRQDKVADAITAFAGSMKFVYLHLMVYGIWVIANLPWLPFPKFDPTYVVLAMEASVEAIFISTFVLISQNRIAKVADQRADLDLQISLLTEHEITRVVKLVTEIGRKMALPSAENPELHELAQDVAPEQILDRMQETEEQVGDSLRS